VEALRTYLNTLPLDQQEAYAKRCGTTIGYLRKAISKKQQLGAGLVVALDRESEGAVPIDDTSPDVDWEYVRGTAEPVGARRKRSRDQRATSRPS